MDGLLPAGEGFREHGTDPVRQKGQQISRTVQGDLGAQGMANHLFQKINSRGENNQQIAIFVSRLMKIQGRFWNNSKLLMITRQISICWLHTEHHGNYPKYKITSKY